MRYGSSVGWTRRWSGAQAATIQRLVLVFLLLVVPPIQASWAAVGGYCRHESGEAARHIGHHDHRHHSQSGDKDGAIKPALQDDADCATCHLTHPCTLLAPSPFTLLGGAFPGAGPPRLSSSLFPEEPERPKWASPV